MLIKHDLGAIDAAKMPLFHQMLRYLMLYQIMCMYYGEVYIAIRLQRCCPDLEVVNRIMFDRGQTNQHTCVNRFKNRTFELRDAVHLYNAAIKLGHMSKLPSPWKTYRRIIGKTAHALSCNQLQYNGVRENEVGPCKPHIGVTPLITGYSLSVRGRRIV